MHKLKQLVPQSIKNLYHLGQAVLANLIYGFPTKELKVIGITGTDGKTTTTQMVTKILEEAGKKVAMASTINFVINGVEEKNLSHYTTESAFAVQKFAREAAGKGCEYLVLETSSHSLDQYRVWGVEFQTAVITNVTREHLDYHGTMEKYREAKKRLFEMVSRKSKVISNRSSVIIVNLDMEDPEYFLGFDVDEKFAYTTKKVHSSAIGLPGQGHQSSGDLKIIHAENIELGISGSKYEIRDTRYEVHLPGLFNIENALAATCVGLSEGIELETIKEALAKIQGVAGRLERVENDRGVNILVDFALTPDSLEKLYSFLVSVKKNAETKIIAVFGSCGDRDKGKRPLMGKVVSDHADYVILTNDEPYHEDPEKIIDEIAVGIINKKESESFWKISDRREAIAKALTIAKAGDMVVVTGMGDLESMVVEDKKIPWNDQKVILEELQK